VSVGAVAPELKRPAADARPSARALSGAVLLAGGLTVVAAILRFYRLGHQGFWFDEANTALLVHLSPGKMLQLLPQNESTPPLYYCVAWVWSRIFGSGEAGLRSLSAVAGVATVPVAYLAGAKLITPRAGVVVAALAAFNPFLIWYSQEARSYSLLVLFGAASLCAFAYALEQPTGRRMGLWVLACALALATHYYAVLAVIPEALWLLAVHWRTRALRIALVPLGACGIALIPLAISQSGTDHSSWIARIPLTRRLSQVGRQLLIGTGAPAHRLLLWLSFAVVALALVLLLRVAGERERRGARVAAGLAGAGLALVALLIIVGIDDLITRNIILVWLPLALIVAAGLGARRAGLLGVAGAATLCVIGAVATIGVALDRNLERPDWRVVAHALGPGPAAGAPAGRAVLIQRDVNRLPLSLYMKRLDYVGHGSALIDELDVIAAAAPQQNACWWGAACNLFPSRLSPTLAVPRLHVSGPILHVDQFSIMRLRASRPIRITPRMLSRALTTTKLRGDAFLVQRPG
jgi:mannosyltransferase